MAQRTLKINMSYAVMSSQNQLVLCSEVKPKSACGHLIINLNFAVARCKGDVSNLGERAPGDRV